MPRYYLSHLVLNSKGRWWPVLRASEAWEAEESPQIHSLTSGFTNNQPDVPWSLVTLHAEDHEAFAQVEGSDQLPDFPVEGLLSEMGVQVFDDMRTRLIARGIDAGAIDAAATFLDVLTHIAVNVLGATGFIPGE